MNKAITIFTFAFFLLSVAGYGQLKIETISDGKGSTLKFVRETYPDYEEEKIFGQGSGSGWGSYIYGGEGYPDYYLVDNELWDKYGPAYGIKKIYDSWWIETDDEIITPDYIVFYCDETWVYPPLLIASRYFSEHPDKDTFTFKGYYVRSNFAPTYEMYEKYMDGEYKLTYNDVHGQAYLDFVVGVRRHTDKNNWKAIKALNKMLDILTIPQRSAKHLKK